MTQAKANCWTLKVSGVHEGVHQVMKSSKKHVLAIGTEFPNDDVPMEAGSRGEFPIHSDGTLWSAIPIIEGQRVRKLVGGAPWGIAVLAINPRGLQLGGAQLLPTDLVRSLVWPGGEGVDIPRIQHGDRADLDQKQLFVLRNGQWLIVVDKERSVSVVRLDGNVFSFRSATPDDLFDHLVGRTLMAKTFQEVRWCLRVLKALGMQDRADVVIAKAISLKPDYRHDWKNL